MQNKKITFLLFSTDYTVVQIGLVSDGLLQETVTEHKFTASKNLMPVILALLARHQLTFADLSFLATNQGPGPFTTLRAIITTLNGLSFATGLSLVGIDGLQALLETPHTPAPTLALLNAFGQDVYYGYYHQKQFLSGWAPINQLLARYKQQFLEQYSPHTNPVIIGNGVTVFAAALKEQLPDAKLIDQAAPDLTTLAHMALAAWHKKETATMLLPLYLKTMEYHQST